jgi:hypothetical protein
MKLEGTNLRRCVVWSGLGFAAGAALASFLATGSLGARIESIVQSGVACGVIGWLAAFVYELYRRNP